MNLLEKILGTHSEREIKKLMPIVEKIESLDEKMQKLTDEELKNKTIEFKERLQKGETLEDILPEAFAVVREASVRTIGLKHFKVQLLGGIVLHQGRIAEMKTGEGKTLVATLPAYLNALTGKGVHIVTVNDYLAKRDRDLMGKIYEFLGLSVGVITPDLSHEERKRAYLCDITYGTNSEFGFDYLRDNMAKSLEETVQRELNFAIIDEVDSILIDEARTPLIIAGDNKESTKLYELADNFVRLLKKGDFKIDEKERTIVLTESGVRKAEEFFKLENYSDIDNYEIQHHINQALRAHHIMRINIDYIVKDGEVLIVDEFTGRIMDGRRFSDGLHEAIESKEKVQIKEETKTLATITLQNYFRLYKKISGMTGTAQTEEAEFREIYGLDVVVIPTNKPVIRIDHPDIVYKTEKAKFNAVVEEIVNTHKTGQPVLVGTTSIEKSEMLSEMLKKRGIPHQVLNAKHHEREAEIVSHAGEKGMVTIATNMAGRGTDIKLGEGVAELGGLKVIGTERHESRRIDNQLRGRSGRQGDPGSSRFYVSLEDELIQRFGSDKLKNLATKLGISDDEAIESSLVTKAIEDAQKRVEEQNFEIRKNLLQYDNVLSRQREIIYAERRRILEGDDFRENIKQMIRDVVDCIIENNTINPRKSEYNMKEIEKRIRETFFLSAIELEYFKGKNKDEFKQNLINLGEELYKAVSRQFKEEEFRQIEKHVILSAIDNCWVEHIDMMERFKKGIGLRALRHQDPVREYTIEGMRMFEEMTLRIKEMTLSYLFKQKPRHNEEIQVIVEK